MAPPSRLLRSLLPHSREHWFYVWIPIFGSVVWFGTILSLLVIWLATGRIRYPSMEGSIAYLSDVGAYRLKPLFVVGCCITAVSFFSSVVIERWLRHSDRLYPHMKKREEVLGILSILGSFISGIGLILLSAYDTQIYPTAHIVFMLFFIVGVGLSAIFTVIEYSWLSKELEGVTQLKIAYIMKAVISSILMALGIVSGALTFKYPDPGAIAEWTLSLGFTCYLLTYFYDLRSRGKRHGENDSKEGLQQLRVLRQPS